MVGQAQQEEPEDARQAPVGEEGPPAPLEVVEVQLEELKLRE